MVGGQYEVAGALAHGGLGWIYLARDRNVSDRWVVLKGLLNAGDADAQAAAIAERGFLAQVEHPRIVEIYNFVVHEGAGYTVMEYVGGTSLKQVLKERMAAAGRYDPLPLDQAIAYVLEILPAFEYLHDLGLVYCDFKPDNLIQVGDDVKLIDLGGVRRIDDVDSAIYGTVGYQAPEVPEVGTSVASDVYTIGRTLLVLAMEFRGYQSTYVASLPPVAETPLFQRYDSFYRLVAKACAYDAADRFASVAELRVQLHGVLREVVAADRGEAAASVAAPSLLFGSPDVATSELTWRDLPRLAVDPSDPQAGWLATLGVEDPQARLAALAASPMRSAEVLLAAGRTALEAGRPRGRRGGDRRAARRGPVGVARGVAPGPGRAGPGRRGRGPGRVQRGVRPGARRARAQARARRCLRGDRRDRHRRGAVRGVRPDRRRLRGAGRVRAGPDPVGARLRRPRPSRRWSWCRRPAGPTPRRGRTGPPRCWRPAGACRPTPRRWPASRSPASTRSSG